MQPRLSPTSPGERLIFRPGTGDDPSKPDISRRKVPHVGSGDSIKQSRPAADSEASSPSRPPVPVRPPETPKDPRGVPLVPFKLGEPLGRGAYGKVYKAMVGGQFYAVKQIALNYGGDGTSPDDEALRDEVASLSREIETLKALEHPRIVRYIGCEIDSKHMHIFLEFMPNGSIRDMVKKFGAFTEVLVRKYTRQMVEGLCFLHSRKIIHRDVKGANILVDLEGDAKLADFGASEQLDILMGTMTGGMQQLQIQGSVFWMAPEVVKDHAGRRSDIWSAGCVVIEMATAKHPWQNLRDRELPDALRYIVDSAELPPFPEKISTEGETFLRRCLRRDPRQRPYCKDLLTDPFIAPQTPDERAAALGLPPRSARSSQGRQTPPAQGIRGGTPSSTVSTTSTTSPTKPK
mmetsp:Transcript_20481/g.49736  ORF Transcript_20481/g.49736 Transcript_20481/m.49736 type:complete len:405 (+) Transcript_20481:2-1216(+)